MTFIYCTECSITAHIVPLQHAVFHYSTQRSVTARDIPIWHTTFNYHMMFHIMAHDVPLQHTFHYCIKHYFKAQHFITAHNVPLWDITFHYCTWDSITTFQYGTRCFITVFSNFLSIGYFCKAVSKQTVKHITVFTNCLNTTHMLKPQ